MTPAENLKTVTGKCINDGAVFNGDTDLKTTTIRPDIWETKDCIFANLSKERWVIILVYMMQTESK
jgi:hypothetical protein